MPIKTMIIDDAAYVRNDLKNMIDEVNSRFEGKHIEVVCEAGTITEAKKLLLENAIDLVFLDVRLRGGTGFDLVPFIDASVEIIFITTYDEYALRAFEVNALDYLLKPVVPRRLAEALLKIKEPRQTAYIVTSPVKQKASTPILRSDDFLMIKQDTNRFFVPISDIVAIFSIGGNYVTIYTQSGDKMTTRKTMKKWEKILPDSVFIRIHRSAIINIRFTRQITAEKDGTCKLIQLGCEKSFVVSRGMSARLKGLFEQRGK